MNMRSSHNKCFQAEVMARRPVAVVQVLSLSRNRFRTLSHFQNFINLQELNMNFNQLESLEGLVAPNLQKLFLSNNRWRRLLHRSVSAAESDRCRACDDDGRLTSIQHIGRFPRLTTLCLFRNLLPDLEEALSQLRALSRLRDVALDGNPCARHADYRHRMVRAAARLCRLPCPCLARAAAS